MWGPGSPQRKAPHCKSCWAARFSGSQGNVGGRTSAVAHKILKCKHGGEPPWGTSSKDHPSPAWPSVSLASSNKMFSPPMKPLNRHRMHHLAEAPLLSGAFRACWLMTSLTPAPVPEPDGLRASPASPGPQGVLETEGLTLGGHSYPVPPTRL